MKQNFTGQAFERLRDWVTDWQRRRLAEAEIRDLSKEDRERTAADLGVDVHELEGVASWCQEGPAELMPARLEALGLDPEGVRQCEPAVFRDMQRVCGRCHSSKQCARDLADGDVEAGMREYCPNASTIDALLVERGL